MVNITNANRIQAASTPEDWRNSPGFLRATWLKTVLDDLKLHKLTLTEVTDMAHNWSLWRLLAICTLCAASQ